MCIPPVEEDPNFFFKELNQLNKNLDLKELSMGMSADYIEAAKNFSTFLRIGSKIFGNRSQYIIIFEFLLISLSIMRKSFFLSATQPAVGL